MNKWMQWLVRILCKHKGKTKNAPASRDNGAQERERARQAHYMRNFWNYNGAEQQEWDEV